MTTTNDERTTHLRSALVATVNESGVARTRPWRVISLVAVIALVSGATGAVSASAIARSAPYSDEVITTLALAVARPNSVPHGQPFYVSGTGTSRVAVGTTPAGATALAIRNGCSSLGKVSISIDDEVVGGFDCTADSSPIGGGGPITAKGQGPHTVTFTSTDNASYEAWMVWVTLPPLPTSSSMQDAEMADGTVTRAEYLAAFNRYVGCMNGAGYDIIGADTNALIIDFSITAAAVDSGVDEFCYGTQFGDVDAAWQVQNEDSSQTAQFVHDCLIANGISPAKKLTDALAQLTAAGIEIGACM
jgi:hypothetical protein